MAKGAALARVQPFPQPSALALVQPSACASSLSLSLEGWVNPLGWTLRTPDFASQAGVQQQLHPIQMSERTNVI